MVASGGARDTAQGNLGGYLAGGQEKAAGREGHILGAGGEDRRIGKQESVDAGKEMGDAQVGGVPHV